MERVMTVCTPPLYPLLNNDGKRNSSPLRGEGWVRVVTRPLFYTLPLVPSRRGRGKAYLFLRGSFLSAIPAFESDLIREPESRRPRIESGATQGQIEKGL